MIYVICTNKKISGRFCINDELMFHVVCCAVLLFKLAAWDNLNDQLAVFFCSSFVMVMGRKKQALVEFEVTTDSSLPYHIHAAKYLSDKNKIFYGMFLEILPWEHSQRSIEALSVLQNNELRYMTYL